LVYKQNDLRQLSGAIRAGATKLRLRGSAAQSSASSKNTISKDLKLSVAERPHLADFVAKVG
jgi:hypothetical protein